MLTTAHTNAAIGERLDVRLAPTARAAGAARARGLGLGPDGHRAGVVGIPGVGISGRLRSGHPGNTTDTGSRIGVPSVGCARMPTATMPITGDPAADELLVTDPLALVIGMLLDQQVPMEWAFRGPSTLRDRLGRLDCAAIAAMPVDDLEAVFKEKPALHRYPGSMAKRTHALCEHVVEEYDGDAGKIWKGTKDPQVLFDRIRALPGYGDEKAKIFLAILGKRLEGRAEGLGGVRGAVLRRQPALGRRHRLAREPPARARLEAGPEGRQEVEGRVSSSTCELGRRLRPRSRAPIPGPGTRPRPPGSARPRRGTAPRRPPAGPTPPARPARARRSPARAPACPRRRTPRMRSAGSRGHRPCSGHRRSPRPRAGASPSPAPTARRSTQPARR